jgi:hypothetical protein
MCPFGFPHERRMDCSPLSLRADRGMQKCTDKHEYQPTDPLSLRERVGVRVNTYPFKPSG